jgi:diguanylate cyclase (GGDEF)-like protein
MAIVTENTLKAHGYKIPDDIIVTGFDGIPEINFAAPVISSCLCDFSDLADKVADIADKAQRGESVNGSYPIIPRLLLSESCGCCTKSTFNSSEYLRRTSDRFYRYREEERHLNTISSNIQLANSPQQIFDHLNQTVIYNTCCILNEECLDPTFNPRQKRDGSPFSENMYVIFDDNYKREMVGRKIDSEIRKQKLGYQLALPYPVIFNALNFRDITLGYVCFHFTDYDIDNYVKISQVINSLDNAVNGFRNMRYQQYINTQMEQMYKFDMMTGLYNRNGCIKEFEHVKAHAEDVGEPVSFLLADLDGLKKINDGYGHCEGDNAISTAARAIRSALPKSAIGARIGGDEMIAFWCGKADREKICGDVEEYLDCYNKVSGKPYKVGVSIGIYVSDNEGLEFDSFIKKADEPMYENKAKRRI